MNVVTDTTLQKYDIVILTETLATKPIEIAGKYASHSPAMQGPTGRPAGGVSCYYNPSIGQKISEYTEKNMVIVKTNTVTLIGAYFNPKTDIVEVIDSMINAIKRTNPEETVILAGDFNCRLDTNNQRSRILMDTLEEEGFRLINDPDHRTYYARNGSSTIDLIFIKGNNARATKQEVLMTSELTTLRKHIPVVTNIEIENSTKRKATQQRTKTTRELNIEKLREAEQEIQSIKENIRQNKITEATEKIEHLIMSATTKRTRRKAKPWFDATCYSQRTKTLEALYQAKSTNKRRDLDYYADSRRKYKLLLKEKQNEFTERVGLEMAEAAKKDPFVALKRRKTTHAPNIEIETWHKHFQATLNPENKDQAYDKIKPPSDETPKPVTKQEILSTIKKLKKNKAAGPDGIYNEFLKESTAELTTTWVELLNKCLELGEIPNTWRQATMKVLYKGKGPTNDPNSYRGIALENNPFKLLTSILNARLTSEIDRKIPEQQFGFRKGRSTLQAVDILLKDIREALSEKKQKFYAVFVDYSKAFDNVNRKLMIGKLRDMVEQDGHTLTLIHNILAQNAIKIDDSVRKSKQVNQTRGVLQGDPLSPLLFNVMTADITQICHPSIKMYMYADDMVLGSTDRKELQESIHNLEAWAVENGFTINLSKTMQMVFRKGGRLTEGDHIQLQNKSLQITNAFKYLGVTLQTTARSFRIHTKERAAAAIIAIHDIQNISQLSLETAMKLFEAKVLPILTYGIETTWTDLSLGDLNTMEKVKARFLKAALGISKFAPSRLAYELTRETFLVEDLRTKFLLPANKHAAALKGARQQKRNEIPEDFYATDAMTDRSWTGPNNKIRSALTRLAVHGYHHKLCRRTNYHDPSTECVCKLCHKPCARYHFNECSKRTKSLLEYSRTKN